MVISLSSSYNGRPLHLSYFLIYFVIELNIDYNCHLQISKKLDDMVFYFLKLKKVKRKLYFIFFVKKYTMLREVEK